MKIVGTKKETVGSIARELMLKAPETRDPIELEREMQQDYLKYLIECVEQHKKTLPGDFYVEVTTKNEPLLPNVFRNYFSARNSCPTPNYDQSIFFYNKKEDRIEYIWTLPSREVSHYLLKNRNEIVPSEQQLLKFVIEFALGDLFALCKKLNGEMAETSALEA